MTWYIRNMQLQLIGKKLVSIQILNRYFLITCTSNRTLYTIYFFIYEMREHKREYKPKLARKL